MDKGNWIAIDKRIVALLPKDRSYTIIEAMISYATDRDNQRQGTINGYAQLWGWSRKKVRHFIKTLESGQDYYGDRKGTGRGHPIRLIINKLQSKGNRKGTSKGTLLKDTNTEPINDKGILHIAKSYPLPFSEFLKRHNQEKTDAVEAVQYFLMKYKQNVDADHKLLRPDTWQQVIDTILYDGMEEELEYVDLCVMIDKYFQIEFEGCDYSICHFNTAGIKMRRFYEELY